MNRLILEHISHAYDGHPVLRDVSLVVAPGEIACLLGPSGCGKTTLLRIAAGLEEIQSGSVIIGNETVAVPGMALPPEKRHVGLMFQDFALFPHLTVAGNVAFGLTDLGAKKSRARVAWALDRVHMRDYSNAYPHMLSGGEQQRVALARSLAPEPRVMLLDEPFSGLDETTRVQVREETLAILKEAGAATLMVTHHPEEAMFMADRLQVMGTDGVILQAGDPIDVYSHPADPFVAGFFGPVNELRGRVAGGAVATPLGPVVAAGFEDGAEVIAIIRQDGIELDIGGDKGLAVDIVAARPLGRSTHVRFRVRGRDGPEFQCRVPGLFEGASGRTIGAQILPGHAFIFAVSAAGSGGN
jgi:iron(III) transport system ATP-binding protein